MRSGGITTNEEIQKALCVARGGTWDNQLEFCREGMRMPAPDKQQFISPGIKTTNKSPLDNLQQFRPDPDRDYGGGIFGPSVDDLELGQQDGERGGGLGLKAGALCLLGPVIAGTLGSILPSTPSAPSSDQFIEVFHYTSLASAEAIATTGMYNASVKGPIDFGMYVTTYDHQSGYNGYRLSKQELQFGLRSTPKTTWSAQSVDGYVKFRIPV